MTEVLEEHLARMLRPTNQSPSRPVAASAEAIMPGHPSTVRSGQELREGREAAGVGARAAAEALRLSQEQLHALENEHWERLPGRPFVRAVLRAYARNLGVDATPLIEKVGGYAQAAVLDPMPDVMDPGETTGLSSPRGLAGRTPRSRPWPMAGWLARITARQGAGRRAERAFDLRRLAGDSGARRWLPAVAGLGVFFLAAGAGIWLLASGGPVVSTAQIDRVELPIATDSAPGALGLSTVPVTIGSAGTLAPAGTAAPARAGQGVVTTTVFAPAARATPPVAAVPSESAAAGAGSSATAAAKPSPVEAATQFPVGLPDNEVLNLHFSSKVWVDIRHKDGERLLVGEQRANRSITLKGVPPLSVVIGNPNAVKMEFRGEAVDLEPRINSKGIARFTLK